MPGRVATASKEPLIGLPTGLSQVLVDGLARLLREFKFDRTTGFALPNDSTVERIAARRNVFNAQSDDIATAKLAVNREVTSSFVFREKSP